MKKRVPFFCSSQPPLLYIVLWFLASKGLAETEEVVFIPVTTAYPTDVQLKELKKQYNIHPSAHAFLAGVSEFEKGQKLDQALEILKGQVRRFTFDHLPVAEKQACEWLLKWVIEQSFTGTGKVMQEIQLWLRQAYDLSDNECGNMTREEWIWRLYNEAFDVVKTVFTALVGKFKDKVSAPQLVFEINLDDLAKGINAHLDAELLKQEYGFTKNEQTPFSVAFILDTMAAYGAKKSRLNEVAKFWAWVRYVVTAKFNQAIEDAEVFLETNEVEVELAESGPDECNHKVGSIWVNPSGKTALEKRWLSRGVTHNVFGRTGRGAVDLLVIKTGKSMAILPNKSSKVLRFDAKILVETLNKAEVAAGGHAFWAVHETRDGDWVVFGSNQHPDGPFTVMGCYEVHEIVVGHLTVNTFGLKPQVKAAAKS